MRFSHSIVSVYPETGHSPESSGHLDVHPMNRHAEISKKLASQETRTSEISLSLHYTIFNASKHYCVQYDFTS